MLLSFLIFRICSSLLAVANRDWDKGMGSGVVGKVLQDFSMTFADVCTWVFEVGVLRSVG